MGIFEETKGSGLDSMRFLEFYLGGESYAVELLKVKEVITPPKLTPIPEAPSYVSGLINLRDLVIGVIDLRKKLGITPDKDTRQTAVIIFDLEGGVVGVIVDSIQGVINITKEGIKPIPDAEGKSSAHLMGILQQEKKLSIWLDPQNLFNKNITHIRAAA